MRIGVLGATGATGRLLVTDALARGHDVTALARDPARIPTGDHPRLTTVAADVLDPDSITRAVKDCDVLVSGLGNTGTTGTLTAGARAAVTSGVPRIVWLGAYGSGASAHAAGAITRTLLRAVMNRELPDKVTADSTIIAAGGTVFHAGPLTTGPLAPARRTRTLDDAPRRLFPATVSRATVAAQMLDEAERPRFAGTTVIPATA